MTHKDLIVWKKSIDFVTELYSLTGRFPDAERFGLTNQMRRCSVSVPSNIAEGAARKSNKEFVRFLYISLGSASELQTQLVISRNLNFISPEQYEEFNSQVEEISRMISGLIRSVESKDSNAQLLKEEHTEYFTSNPNDNFN